MIITLKKNADKKQVDCLLGWLRDHKVTPHVSAGESETIIGCVGDVARLDIGLVQALSVVEAVQRIQEPYKEANRRFHPEDTVVDCSGYKVGDVLKCDQFAQGDKIDITGTSKGHGYTGAIARWNQHTGPMAHGSKYHRGVGSLSANSDPSRVFKNKHMAGHYGVDRVTVQNLEVVQVDAERNLLLVKGAVPGPNEGLLIIRDTCKA